MEALIVDLGDRKRGAQQDQSELGPEKPLTAGDGRVWLVRWSSRQVDEKVL
jgi:hypothetical protein